MPVYAVASQGVLIITAAVLFYVALADFKHYRIRNEVVLVLAGLFFVHALLSGRWTSMQWNIGFAVLMFGIMLYYYSMKLMGGGDLKLLTVAFLWVGPFSALAFSVFLLLFVGIHIAAVKLKWVEAPMIDNRKRIPFAPAIAAALIGVFVTGFLRPM